jgi:carbon-monoxide dehydrogenase large subunit
LPSSTTPGGYDACLDEAMKIADTKGFAARKADAAKRGKLRGIGYASYIEACGIAPSNVAGALGARAGLFEAGEVRVHPTAASRSSPDRTATARATRPRSRRWSPRAWASRSRTSTWCTAIPAACSSVWGHTDRARSRSAGTAIVKAVDKIVAKGKKIAAHLLEAAESDIEFRDGKFTVAGTDRSKTFGEVALTAYVPHNYPLDKLEPGFERDRVLRSDQLHLPGGHAHLRGRDRSRYRHHAGRELQRLRRLRQHHQPDDRRGQVHGGLAQGIGQALLESCVYDKESGQLLTGSYMDYAMPRADDLPSFKVAHEGHAVHAQPAGRQGLRRGGRDRRPPRS